MLPKIRQQAWIRGLPGLDKEGGFPLETLPISTPKSDERSLSVTLYGSTELVSNLESLSKQRTKLPQFSLTVRTDATKEQDNQFQMMDVVIDSILPLKAVAGVQVNILFNSISAKMGVSLNPGPPVNHPPIQPTGVNMGWIFGLPHEDFINGRPFAIVDFTAPFYDRRLTVTLGNPSGEIQNLIKKPTPKGELILVLPDRSSQRYVEFKLWDAKTVLLEEEQHVAFESNMIVCLTGQET